MVLRRMIWRLQQLSTAKEVQVEHVVNYRFLTLVTFLLIFSRISYGQIEQEAKYKDGDLSFRKLIVKELYEKWSSGVDKVCIDGQIYVQFSIDEVGSVVDVKFYEVPNTPKIIAQTIRAVLTLTNGKWQTKLIDGKPTKSSTYLLPFKIHLEAGCGGINHQLADARPFGLVQFLTDMKQVDNIIILKPVYLFSAR